MNKITEEELIDLGFEFNPKSLITKNYRLNVKRNIWISVSDLGTVSEFVFISQGDSENPKDTDVIALWNYDYDKNITIKKLTEIVNSLKTN